MSLSLILLFLVFTEIHPFPEGTFTFAVAFIQIQVAVWIIELADFLHLLIEIGVNSLANPF